jgi:folate-dependent phosphoribosylglycinamide formyltransferase PurN/peptidoglycan/xylan/chitin deacetylase (PgdA/CDA1 family)
MSEREPLKVAVLTSLNNAFIAQLISQFVQIREIELGDVVYWLPRPRSWQTFRWNLRKHGLIYVPWRIGYSLVAMIKAAWGATIGRYLYGTDRPESLFSICSTHNLRLHRIANIHSEEGIALVRELQCDLLLVCGTGILKPAVFTLPRVGTLNLHQGEAPRYRGAPPGFWELWNREKQAGITIHFIDAGVDTGDIVLQELVPIFPSDTLQSVQEKLSETALRLYPAAVRQVAQGTCVRHRQTGGGKQYYFPTLWQQARLKWRLLHGQRKWQGALRAAAKGCYYILILLLHGIFRRLFRRKSGRLVVLYYHRVSNLCQDGMTIGAADFENHVRLLTRHYQVLSPADLLELAREGGKLERDACLITFDDGYEDNYLMALPVLTRYRCPAIFFVSTGLVGEELSFGHDMHLAAEIRFRNLSWDQIRICEKAQIGIGVHSHTHRNLGRIGFAEAVEEVETSLRVYREQMGHDALLMSYPFGKEQDITPELRDYVEHKTGLQALFSAYGGINRFPLQPYNILRINMGTGDTGLAFLYKLRGGWRELAFWKAEQHG